MRRNSLLASLLSMFCVLACKPKSPPPPPEERREPERKDTPPVEEWKPLRSSELTLSHWRGMYDAAFSPDGTRIAGACGDGTIQVWEYPSGKKIISVPCKPSPRSVAFHPDGTLLAAGNNKGTVLVFDAGSGEIRSTLETGGEDVLSVAFHPRGETLISATARRLTVWDWRERKQVATQDSIRTWAVGMTRMFGGWDAAGENLLLLRENEAVSWNVAEARERMTWSTGRESMTAAAWDGRTLVYGSTGIRICSVESDEEMFSWMSGSSAVDVAISPSGRLLASVTSDGKVEIRSSPGGRLLRSRYFQGRGEFRLVFHSKEPVVAVVSKDPGAIHLWDFRAQLQPPLLVSGRRVQVRFTRDGGNAVVLRDKTVETWDLGARRKRASWESPNWADHRTLWIGAALLEIEGAEIRIVEEGKPARSWKAPGAQKPLHLSRDGRRLVTEGPAGTLSLWDLEKGESLRTWKAMEAEVFSVALSDARLAACDNWARIKVWDLESGKEIQSAKSMAFAMEFDPKGTLLFGLEGILAAQTSGANEAAVLVQSGPGRFQTIVVSPAGDLSVAGDTEGNLAVVSLSPLKPMRLFRAHSAGITSLAFSEDGARLASGDSEGAVRIWGKEDLLREDREPRQGGEKEKAQAAEREKEQDWRKAAEAWEEALEILPDDSEAHAGWLRCFERLRMPTDPWSAWESFGVGSSVTFEQHQFDLQVGSVKWTRTLTLIERGEDKIVLKRVIREAGKEETVTLTPKDREPASRRVCKECSRRHRVDTTRKELTRKISGKELSCVSVERITYDCKGRDRAVAETVWYCRDVPGGIVYSRWAELGTRDEYADSRSCTGFEIK